MKKIIFVLASLLALALFAGCSNDSDSASTNVVATTTTNGTFAGTVTVGTVAENVTINRVEVNSTNTAIVSKTATGYQLSIPTNVSYRVTYVEAGQTKTALRSYSGGYANVSITQNGGKWYFGNELLSVTGSFDANFTISSITLQVTYNDPTTVNIPFTITNLVYTKQ